VSPIPERAFELASEQERAEWVGVKVVERVQELARELDRAHHS
jgi:hypothetical protein